MSQNWLMVHRPRGIPRPRGIRPPRIPLIALLVVCACGSPEPQEEDLREERVETADRSATERSAADPASDTSSPDIATPESQADSLSAALRVALERRLRGEREVGEREVGEREVDVGDGVESHSWFSAETAGALRSATVDTAGHATVDFHDLRPLIPNASTSAGSAVLIGDLNAVVFDFPEIRSVEYRMEGSCDLFWEWLQIGCQTVTRDDVDGEAPVEGGS